MKRFLHIPLMMIMFAGVLATNAQAMSAMASSPAFAALASNAAFAAMLGDQNFAAQMRVR